MKRDSSPNQSSKRKFLIVNFNSSFPSSLRETHAMLFFREEEFEDICFFFARKLKSDGIVEKEEERYDV